MMLPAPAVAPRARRGAAPAGPARGPGNPKLPRPCGEGRGGVLGGAYRVAASARAGCQRVLGVETAVAGQLGVRFGSGNRLPPRGVRAGVQVVGQQGGWRRPAWPSSGDHVQIGITPRRRGTQPALLRRVLAWPSCLNGPLGTRTPRRRSGSACGAQQLHCGVEPRGGPEPPAHPALLTDDLDARPAPAWRQAGFPIRTDAELPGYRRFYTEDPVGQTGSSLMQPIDRLLPNYPSPTLFPQGRGVRGPDRARTSLAAASRRARGATAGGSTSCGRPRSAPPGRGRSRLGSRAMVVDRPTRRARRTGSPGRSIHWPAGPRAGVAPTSPAAASSDVQKPVAALLAVSSTAGRARR